MLCAQCIAAAADSKETVVAADASEVAQGGTDSVAATAEDSTAQGLPVSSLSTSTNGPPPFVPSAPRRLQLVRKLPPIAT